MEPKDKVSKCACGNESISDNCVGALVSKIRCFTPKCSNYDSNSNSNSNSTSDSGSSSNPNPNPKSESIPKDNTKDIINPNRNRNPNPNGETWRSPILILMERHGRSPILIQMLNQMLINFN